jgi:hypothetical protein
MNQTTDSTTTEQLQAALELASLGYNIIRLLPRSKLPYRDSHGWQDGTTDPELIRSLFSERPRSNVAISCRLSDTITIDADEDKGGLDQLHELERELGPLPSTPTAISGGGGTHHYLRHPGVPLIAGLPPGIHLRDQNYCVAPPSVHPDTGRRYAWEQHPADTPLAEIPPAWLQRLAARPSPRPPGPRRQTNDWLRSLPPERYALDIAGLVPNRGGFVSCPSPDHDDIDPSLRLYDDHFHCYGCNAHGGIFNFWALTIGYTGQLAGAVFLTIEEQILDFYEELLTGGKDMT